MNQHAKLSITSDTSSLSTEESTKSSYQYDQNSPTYYPTSSEQQKIMKVQSTSTSTWNERGVFFLTSIGFTTGLQGICLFPVLCELNGGTVFVFCTTILYLLLGIPIVLVETGLGQLSKLSPAILFPKLCPLLSGLGFSMCWSSAVFSLSEASVLSWSVLYIYKSMECDLPWAHYRNYTPLASSANYFTTEILGTTSKSEEFGKIQGHLVLALAITWAVVAACLGSGIRHTGKFCYITTPITFLSAGIVLVRGLFLWNEAVSQGVSPQWSKISDISVWFTAACYVFHSLNLGLGGLTAISSHNKQNTNIIRDSMLVCLVHFLWGVAMWLMYACLTAEHRNNDELQIGAGPWVLFVVLARSLAVLRHGIVFSMAMYIMIFFVGIGTLLGTILMISSMLLHYVPILQNKRGHVTTGICVVLFLLGIPFTSEAGLHLHLLISYSTINWTLVLYSLCTCFAVTYCYGHRKFISHVCSISNMKLQEIILTHLTVLYCTVIPAILVMLLICSFHLQARLPESMNSHPYWLHCVSWILTTLPVMLIFLCAAFKFIRFCHKLTFLQTFKSLLRPDDMLLEYMSSPFQSSTSCEKTTMTAPVTINETKDYSLVQSLQSSDGNNNLDEYVVSNALHKTYNDHSLF